MKWKAQREREDYTDFSRVDNPCMTLTRKTIDRAQI